MFHCLSRIFTSLTSLCSLLYLVLMILEYNQPWEYRRFIYITSYWYRVNSKHLADSSFIFIKKILRCSKFNLENLATLSKAVEEISIHPFIHSLIHPSIYPTVHIYYPLKCEPHNMAKPTRTICRQQLPTGRLRFSPSQTSDTQCLGIKPAQNLSSGFVE